MKKVLLITTGFIILLVTSFLTVNARQLDNDPPVKILSTAQSGILKLIFASNAEQGVEINFYNEDGFLDTDKINKNLYPKGFLKKYDVRHLTSQSLWVEIRSEQINVTYKVNEYNDRQHMKPVLEKMSFNHPMDVAKN